MLLYLIITVVGLLAVLYFVFVFLPKVMPKREPKTPTDIESLVNDSKDLSYRKKAIVDKTEQTKAKIKQIEENLD